MRMEASSIDLLRRCRRRVNCGPHPVAGPTLCDSPTGNRLPGSSDEERRNTRDEILADLRNNT